MKYEKEYKSYKNFEKGWNNIYELATKYQCRPEMVPKKISQNDFITYCLNDDGEFEYGMYLASMYDLFITYQNTFLKSVIDNLKGNLITKDSIIRDIYVQDATKSEIVSFEINVDRCLFSNFEEMLSIYAQRNCFNNDNTINYSKYKQITYDYSKLNEELEKLFIPGTKMFKTEQKFVTYKYEFLNGTKSTILQEFATKYEQRNLSPKEKEILYNYKNNVKEFTIFLLDLQMIIFYLQKENYTNKITINQVFVSLPKYISINIECKTFFGLNNEFAIEILLGIYEYFEYLCFEKIKENVNIDYKKEISKEGRDRINDYFNLPNQNRLITKEILSSGVRKFISRYLSGLRSDITVKVDDNIFYSLPYKPDLWSKEIYDNPKFSDEFEDITELDIKVKEAIDLCRVLGDDRELFGEDLIIKKNKENNEERINGNPNNTSKKLKKKRQIF